MTCGTCKRMVEELNGMTADAVWNDIDRVVANIAERAPQQAPKLWQRIAVRVDQALDLGLTEKKIRGWVTESITGPSRVGGGGLFVPVKGGTRFVKASQMQEDIKTLVSMVPSDVTAVAGVARSGLSVATMVSMYLHLPMFTIRQNSHDIQQTGNGWRLGGGSHVSPGTGKVLVVDDTVMTGNSMRHIGPLARDSFSEVITAALYVNPQAQVKPDIHVVDLNWPHLLEWNLFNSVLSPNMATDFDGILCRDCSREADDDGPKYLDFIRNAQPLYIARKTPIPLIVTARIEKYRPETMKWLDRWGIKVKQLVMHPADTLAERNRDDIAAYKAKHFDAWARRHRAVPPPLGFIESEDYQARLIAQQTKRMVVCPATAGVY